MRLLVVGAGATGGYFGGRLAQNGRNVTFLVREARAAQLRAHGLQILSPNGNNTLHPPIVTKHELNGPFDAVLLSVKAFSLEAAMTDMAPAIGADTVVMPVLNGMRHMDALTARFGSAVIGGVCKVAASIDPEGRIVQLNRMQELAYGERNGTFSNRTAVLDAFMQDGGFLARLTPSIEREMWEKWVMLAAIGGLNCLVGGTIGAIEAAGGADTATAILAECAAVATAAGQPPAETVLSSIGSAVTAKGSPLTTSMFRDMQSGFPIEAEQIVGDMVARADQMQVPVPLLRVAYIRLRIYENGGNPAP